MSKIALVSFRLGENGREGNRASPQRRAIVEAAVKQASANGTSHVILPGWTFTYSDSQIREGTYQKEILLLAELSRDCRVSIFAEFTWRRGNKTDEFRSPPESLGYLVFEHGEKLPTAIGQHFTSGNGVAKRNDAYQRVAHEVFSGGRSVVSQGVDFLLLVCGENNFLANVQSDVRDRNRVVLRHPSRSDGHTLKALRDRSHTVVLNPAHTEMGNLGKMKRRWSWLSEPREASPHRYCFFTTNVEADSVGGRAMYGFHNGDEILHSPWEREADEAFVVASAELEV